MSASAEIDANRAAFLQSLSLTETEFDRLLTWSVLPESGFTLAQIEWLEQCLAWSPPPVVPIPTFLEACLEQGVIELADPLRDDDDDEATEQDSAHRAERQFLLEIPWHRLVGERGRQLLQSTASAFIGETIEKLRRITIDFSSKDLYLRSCADYDRYAPLIFHALSLVLLPSRPFLLEGDDDFRRRVFRQSFFGRVNESSIIGAFWYLQDRLKEEDRDLFLALRDAMLEKVHWAEHPLLLSIVLKLEKVLRLSKCSKKYGNVEERKPLLAEVENEFKKALTEYDMEQVAGIGRGFVAFR